MRYPLNVTPMAGHQTFNGSGAAPMVLDGSGDQHMHAMGAGDAQMTLDASAVNYARRHASGTAGMDLDAGATWYAQVQVASQAGLELTGAGAPTTAIFPTGYGTMALSADGDAQAAQRSGGVSGMQLHGRYGLPRYGTIPSNAGPAHVSRALQVAPQGSITVAPTKRTAIVPKERTQ